MVGIDPDERGPGARPRARRRGDRRGRRLAARARRAARTSCSRRRRPTPTSRNAPRYREAGIRAVDLTPAARGPYVIPVVNLTEHLDEMNVNMVTCGGQATIPMVHAVSRVVDVPYAEIVATVASRSAGPGTRANIDEFTRTTASAVEVLGGAGRGKAIIILNPAEPPLIMRDTIFCQIPDDADHDGDRGVDRRRRAPGPGVRARLPAAPAPAVRSGRRATGRPAWRSSSRSRGRATTSRRTPATSTS